MKARPFLILAPHLTYPLRNGANILIHNRWSAYSRFLSHVDIIGQHTIRRFVDGKLSWTEEYSNSTRTKSNAALRTILFSSQYQREKFVTPGFIRKSKQYLNDPSYSCTVGSFTYTIPLLLMDPNISTRMLLVETHNDDAKWYRTLRESSNNPLAKLVAGLSERWAKNIVRSYWRDLIFLHLTDTDREGYRNIVANHSSILAPIGVNPPNIDPVEYREQGALRLLFVGSLEVTMNRDALEYFASQYFPRLKNRFGGNLDVSVVGSSPTERVKRLCKDNRWSLHADVSDSTLHALYQRATFTLLPFEYATGAKLKILESLAHGIPFLATSQVRSQLETSPSLCLFSDDPKQWLNHVETIYTNGQTKSDRLALISLAQKSSWSSTARKLHEKLQVLSNTPTEIPFPKGLYIPN